MDEGAFRQAGEAEQTAPISELTEPKNPDRPVSDGKDVEAPISHYVELQGFPYTAEFFDVKGIYDKPDLGMYEEVMNIENAYIQKVEEGEYEDSKDTFKKFIKEAEKATDCENGPTEIRIGKISEWVKFMNNLKLVGKDNIYG